MPLWRMFLILAGGLLLLGWIIDRRSGGRLSPDDVQTSVGRVSEANRIYMENGSPLHQQHNAGAVDRHEHGVLP